MVVVSSTVAEPEDIIFQSPSTKLIVNNDEMGTGTLYITKNNVVWRGSQVNGAPLNISLLYPSISLHAIQRNPIPALFMVLNYELRVPGNSDQPSNANPDDDFDPEDQPITQLRFISENDLADMYTAMNEGQKLHPDQADELDDDEHFMDGEDDDHGDDTFEDAEPYYEPEESHYDEDGGASYQLNYLQIDNSNGAPANNGAQTNNGAPANNEDDHES